MQREFDRFFSNFPSTFGHRQHTGSVPIDIHESENEIVVVCDIPGLNSKEDIHIDIDQNMLHISGSVNKSEEIKDEHMHRQERYMGKFRRSISLPAPVDQEEISATYKNGVLEINMPKLKGEDQKQIDVKFH